MSMLFLMLLITLNNAYTVPYTEINRSTVIELERNNSYPYHLVVLRQQAVITPQSNLFIVVATQNQVNFDVCLESCFQKKQKVCTDLLLTKSNCTQQPILYDRDAILSNSDKHVLTINNQSRYLYIGYPFDLDNITFGFSIETDQDPCKNNCSSVQSGVCQKDQCSCNESNFGEYCQFRKKKLMLDVMHTIVLRGHSWSYVQLTTQDAPLHLIMFDVLQKVSAAFSRPIPNYHQDVYYLEPTNDTGTIYRVQQYVIEGELMFGFYNPHFFPMQFYIKLTTKSQINQESFFTLLNIILISAVVLIVVLCMIKIYLYWRKSILQSRIVIVRAPSRRIIAKKGFKQQFIINHFPPSLFNKLVLRYPSLGEQVECVICMETMKQVVFDHSSEAQSPFNSRNAYLSLKDGGSELDQSMSARAQSVPNCDKLRGELFQCSVTPCYHVFHHVCLMKWLLRQKSCPLCRKEFKEEYIESRAKWIDTDPDEMKDAPSDRMTDRLGMGKLDSQRNNQYVQRMKTKQRDSKVYFQKQVTNFTTINFTSQESKFTNINNEEDSPQAK